jgi:hypothetical protein
MGYLLVGILMIVLIGLLVIALGRGRPPTGTLDGNPRVRAQPSADEATPDASSTATQEQADEARRRTPNSSF